MPSPFCGALAHGQGKPYPYTAQVRRGWAERRMAARPHVVHPVIDGISLLRLPKIRLKSQKHVRKLPEMAFAHSENKLGAKHDLASHLEEVAKLTSEFAGKFGAGDLGHWVGLWHDLGKFHPDFQAYLSNSYGEARSGSQGSGRWPLFCHPQVQLP